jgi:WD40 repeat protein
MLSALLERESGLAWQEGAFGHCPHRLPAAALGDAGLAQRLTPTAALHGHSGSVNALCWSEGGDVLASGGEDCRLRLWRGDRADLLHSVDTVRCWGLLLACGLAASACSSFRLASSCDCGGCSCFRLARACIIGPHSRRQLCTHMHAAACLPAPTCMLLCLSAPMRSCMCAPCVQGHTAHILSASFLPASRGDQLISGAADRQIRHVNVSRGAVRPYLVHAGRVRAVQALDPRGCCRLAAALLPPCRCCLPA